MARRKVNVELNLTPFIDLFSTLVCFLLLTAVWNQVEALSTNVDNVTSSDSQQDQKEKVNLSATIFKDRVEFSADSKVQTAFIRDGIIDKEAAARILTYWRQLYPDRKDIILNTENAVAYKHLVGVFDILVGNGWPDVGVNTQ
jgi:biopolymer transport protein TolR